MVKTMTWTKYGPGKSTAWAYHFFNASCFAPSCFVGLVVINHTSCFVTVAQTTLAPLWLAHSYGNRLLEFTRLRLGAIPLMQCRRPLRNSSSVHPISHFNFHPPKYYVGISKRPHQSGFSGCRPRGIRRTSKPIAGWGTSQWPCAENRLLLRSGRSSSRSPTSELLTTPTMHLIAIGWNQWRSQNFVRGGGGPPRDPGS